MLIHLFKRQIKKCGQEISVLLRELDESDFDSSQPDLDFTEIDTPLAIVRTINGSERFSGVNIDESATHIFCVEYTVGLAAVEFQNYFVDLKNKRFKVLKVTNVNEKDQVLVIQTTDRGDSSEKATEA